MILPTIHLNGTHPRDLLEQQCKAMQALRDAITALGNAGPNGRDYYPQGPQVIQHALEEHEGRILALRNILGELDAIARHVAAKI